MANSAYLVIFDAMVNGQNARTEVPTTRNPLNSRSVRRDCEAVARKSFEELAAKVGATFPATSKIKAIECIEVKEPEPGETEH